MESGSGEGACMGLADCFDHHRRLIIYYLQDQDQDQVGW